MVMVKPQVMVTVLEQSTTTSIAIGLTMDNIYKPEQDCSMSSQA